MPVELKPIGEQTVEIWFARLLLGEKI